MNTTPKFFGFFFSLLWIKFYWTGDDGVRLRLKEKTLSFLTVRLFFFCFFFHFPGAHFLLCRGNKSESASDHVGPRDVKQKARVERLPDPIWIQLPARISAPLVCGKKSTLLLNVRLVRQISRCIHTLCVLRPVLSLFLHGDFAETLLNLFKDI